MAPELSFHKYTNFHIPVLTTDTRDVFMSRCCWTAAAGLVAGGSLLGHSCI